MTDTTWAAKVLADCKRWSLVRMRDPVFLENDKGELVIYDDALAAIARMGAGDGLVERLTGRARFCRDRGEIKTPELLEEAADHITTLTAQNREMALDVLASSGQAQEAYAAQLAAEAERDALRERVARLEGALADMPKAVLRTTICQGPAWPDDRPGVWLAALEACAKSVQAAVDAALTDGGKDG